MREKEMDRGSSHKKRHVKDQCEFFVTCIIIEALCQVAGMQDDNSSAYLMFISSLSWPNLSQIILMMFSLFWPHGRSLHR